MLVAVLLQKFHHHHVVVQGGGGSYDFVEIRREGHHLFQSFFQFLGGRRVVVGENQRRFVAKPLQLRGFAMDGGLQLYVDQLTARRRGLSQNVKLGRHGTPEFPTAGGPSTGRNDYDVRVVFGKSLDLWQGEQRLGKIV